MTQNQEIEKYRNDLEVIRNTAEQVIKDFDLYGHNITFSGDESMAYRELEQQLVPLLETVYKRSGSEFRNLMYRIDVSETDANKALEYPDERGRFLQLAGLVLEREFMKCVTRKLFSSK